MLFEWTIENFHSPRFVIVFMRSIIVKENSTIFIVIKEEKPDRRIIFFVFLSKSKVNYIASNWNSKKFLSCRLFKRYINRKLCTSEMIGTQHQLTTFQNRDKKIQIHLCVIYLHWEHTLLCLLLIENWIFANNKPQ